MATDFQSLLSSANIACCSALSPGEQEGVKFALLQDIVKQLNPGQATDYETLIKQPNVACYLNQPPGIQQVIKLALLQDILSGIGSGGGPWTPSTPIPGATLVEWLQADALALSQGSLVSTWPATAGLNAAASQDLSGSNYEPSFQTNNQNGLPVVRFNGNANAMKTALFGSALAAPLTVALAFRYNGSAATPGAFVSGITDNTWIGNHYDANKFVVEAGSTGDMASSDANFHILLIVINGSASAYAFDGAALTTFNPGNTGLDGLGIGFQKSQNTLAAQVDIGEILIWSGDASSGYTNIFNYLNNRWFY